MPVQLAVQWAVDTAFDLWQLTHPEKDSKQAVKPMSWDRPLLGWMKCNVDAAFSELDRSAATRVVL